MDGQPLSARMAHVLKARRKQQKLSQGQLATLAKVERVFVTKFETNAEGTTRVPLIKLEKLAVALGWNLSRFFRECEKLEAG